MTDRFPRRFAGFLGIALILGFVLISCSDGPSSPGSNSELNQAGVLMGAVTIGPMCPVEREGVVCLTPAEAFALRKIVVIKGTESRQVDVSSEGRYSVALAPGEYLVQINEVGMDRSAQVPRTVRIEPGATFVLNIDIDTGLR